MSKSFQIKAHMMIDTLWVLCQKEAQETFLKLIQSCVKFVKE